MSQTTANFAAEAYPDAWVSVGTPLYDALLAEQIEQQIRESTGPSRWARFVAAFRRWAQ